ncbi:LysR family transcriptional regulator [Comamonas endophytica]|uniref:LysR family transcriptional regulator n=2 Tax=Comamonas endophytica TaxID=2949090 RepID=A0ABY6GB66_9BURK|nr:MULTISPECIES: LysR family transcriptional regulator [unclassified Acidovorax]MCD2511904.1 LysR family transcriptional regulator [Acidovorax sp. D4N7]UYG51622.1 LysR family transcriptional regulator [Acidovorax sp. 5MLIR]
MDIRQLEAFVAVMTIGSITGAAKLLERSQPAITRQIQELELGLGQALLHRHGPKVTPTELGYVLYEEAERIVNGVRRIQQHAHRAAPVPSPPLLVSATSALSLGVVAPALAACRPLLAAGKIELLSVRPEKVVRDVLHGMADLGVCSLPVDHQQICVHWVAEVPCKAVLPENHPLAAHEVVPIEALARERMIGMHNPHRLKQHIDTALRQAGAGAMQAEIETNSSMNAQALVRAGLGVAVLDPITLLGAPLVGLAYRDLDVRIPFHFGAISAQGKNLTAPALQLLEALRDHAAALDQCQLHDAQAMAGICLSPLSSPPTSAPGPSGRKAPPSS